MSTRSDQVLGLASALVPQIMQFVRDHQAKNGTIPTDAEVQANLQTDADKVQDVGRAWLASHPDA